MKHEAAGTLRKRTIAAICAAAVVFGCTANTFAFPSYADTQNTTESQTSGSASGSISAGGTITSGTRTDSLGLESTEVRLTIDSVLVESGDEVTTGTALYQITADSLSKAEKTLRTELQSAESALLQQKMSYRVDQNQAYALYQSELLLGSTAKQDYEAGLDSLADLLNGIAVHKAKERELVKIRNQEIGFIFQNYHLIPTYTVMQNIIMPLLMRGEDRKTAEKECRDVVEMLGLAERVQHKPSELSGGQR